MATFRTTRKIELDDGTCIYVVREDGNPEVILALADDPDKVVADRTRIKLTLSQANELARALAGIAQAAS